MRRDDTELTKRILKAQMASPLEGDFINLLKSDLESVGIPFSMEITEMSKKKFKKFVKDKVRSAALEYLKKVQQNHSKVRHIKYTQLKPQAYLKSSAFTNDDVKLIFALRTRMSEDFKANFSNKYFGNIFCPLSCKDQNGQLSPDSQQHLLDCDIDRYIDAETLRKKQQINYNDLFCESIQKMKNMISIYKILMEVKKNITEQNPPVDWTGPWH